MPKDIFVVHNNDDDGDLVIRTLATPADTNINGDIFGGWIACQMDIGGAMAAMHYVQGKAVTVAINSMKFIKPVAVGDILCIYAKLLKVGNTSMTYSLKAYVTRRFTRTRELVAEANFVYVRIDENGCSMPVAKE